MHTVQRHLTTPQCPSPAAHRLIKPKVLQQCCQFILLNGAVVVLVVLCTTTTQRQQTGVNAVAPMAALPTHSTDAPSGRLLELLPPTLPHVATHHQRSTDVNNGSDHMPHKTRQTSALSTYRNVRKPCGMCSRIQAFICQLAVHTRGIRFLVRCTEHDNKTHVVREVQPTLDIGTQLDARWQCRFLETWSWQPML